MAQVTIKAHDYKGYKPGLCEECGLDHLHPTHHKGKLRADGWPIARKGPDKAAKKSKPAPFADTKKDD